MLVVSRYPYQLPMEAMLKEAVVPLRIKLTMIATTPTPTPIKI